MQLYNGTVRVLSLVIGKRDCGSIYSEHHGLESFLNGHRSRIADMDLLDNEEDKDLFEGHTR